MEVKFYYADFNNKNHYILIIIFNFYDLSKMNLIKIITLVSNQLHHFLKVFYFINPNLNYLDQKNN